MTFAYASNFIIIKKKKKLKIQHKDWCQVLAVGLIFIGVSKSNINILNSNPLHQLLNYYKEKKKLFINYETSFVISSKICDIPNINKRKKRTNFYL